MTVRQRRPVAKRPPARTAEITIKAGPYAGWWCLVRADFPARTLQEFNSGDVTRILGAFASLVVEHNLPDSSGALAADLMDVDPYDGLVKVAGEVADAIASLPPR